MADQAYSTAQAAHDEAHIVIEATMQTAKDTGGHKGASHDQIVTRFGSVEKAEAALAKIYQQELDQASAQEREAHLKELQAIMATPEAQQAKVNDITKQMEHEAPIQQVSHTQPHQASRPALSHQTQHSAATHGHGAQHQQHQQTHQIHQPVKHAASHMESAPRPMQHATNHELDPLMQAERNAAVAAKKAGQDPYDAMFAAMEQYKAQHGSKPNLGTNAEHLSGLAAAKDKVPTQIASGAPASQSTGRGV